MKNKNIGGQMNELYKFGDGKHIVLHTTDNKTYQWLKQSTKCIKVVPYDQWQVRRGQIKEVTVGADLYFSKHWFRWLERKLSAQNTGVGNAPPLVDKGD